MIQWYLHGTSVTEWNQCACASVLFISLLFLTNVVFSKCILVMQKCKPSLLPALDLLTLKEQ